MQINFRNYYLLQSSFFFIFSIQNTKRKEPSYKTFKNLTSAFTLDGEGSSSKKFVSKQIITENEPKTSKKKCTSRATQKQKRQKRLNRKELK